MTLVTLAEQHARALEILRDHDGDFELRVYGSVKATSMDDPYELHEICFRDGKPKERRFRTFAEFHAAALREMARWKKDREFRT